jgi:transposase
LVTVLQFAEGLTDRQAADAVISRIDWKYLLGLELTDPGFDFTLLCDFRARLMAGGLETKLLENLLERFKQRGLLKARMRQRTDSTHVLAAIRLLNRLELVGETLRHALNSLAVVAPEWLRVRAPQEWYLRYGSRFEQYRLPKAESERQALALQIGADGFQLLGWAYAVDTPEVIRRDSAVEVLRQVWLQQYAHRAEQLVWRSTDDLPPAHLRIRTPYDPEARCGKKRETEWTGYKVHLTETCEADQPHLITQVETTPATLPDNQVIEKIQQELADQDIAPGQHLLDTGYVDAQLLVDAPEQHGTEIIGPVLPDGSWQARQGAGYDQTRFQIDWETQQAICPQGQMSAFWHRDQDRYGRPAIKVHFPKAACSVCPAHNLCTRSDHRTLKLLPQAQFEALHNRREEQSTAEFQAQYARRAGIEGTLSQGVRAYELRRTRYIGQAKTHLQNLLIAIAINLARLVAWWKEPTHPKPYVSPFAALTTP